MTAEEILKLKANSYKIAYRVVKRIPRGKINIFDIKDFCYSFNSIGIMTEIEDHFTPYHYELELEDLIQREMVFELPFKPLPINTSDKVREMTYIGQTKCDKCGKFINSNKINDNLKYKPENVLKTAYHHLNCCDSPSLSKRINNKKINMPINKSSIRYKTIGKYINLIRNKYPKFALYIKDGNKL